MPNCFIYRIAVVWQLADVRALSQLCVLWAQQPVQSPVSGSSNPKGP